MPITVRKFNAQVKDPESGDMIPAGLLSSDALGAINSAKTDAVAAVEGKQAVAEAAIELKGQTTLASIPDDYTALSNEVDDVKTQLIDSGAPNLLQFIPDKSGVSGGVTYSWDGNNLALNGTAGTNGAAINLWTSDAGLNTVLLDGINPGETLVVKVSGATSAARIHIQFYNNSSAIDAGVYLNSDAEIEVPENANGMRLRGWVSANQSVNTIIKTAIYTAKTNREITEMLNNLTPLINTSFTSHASTLANGTDIDNVLDNGWYTLTSGYTYTHSPINGEGAMLFVYAGGAIPVQCMIGTNTDAKKFYTRSGRSSSFVNRDWVNMLPDTISDAYKNGKKYVAFGDSLSYGAVWSPTQGTALHRVKTEWQIPARIALATGMTDNYINAAASGYGYVYKGPGGTAPNIPEQIAAYNFDGVELVTIMAGANDKLQSSIPLGTADSIAGDGSICGAIKSIITYLQTNYPKVQLIIIQPTPSGTAPGNNVWTWRGAGGWSMDDFDDVVSELCHNNHIGYVNWTECSYCNNWTMYNIGYNGNTGPNYTHPVEDSDYPILGDFIAGKISALFKGLS